MSQVAAKKEEIEANKGQLPEVLKVKTYKFFNGSSTNRSDSDKSVNLRQELQENFDRTMQILQANHASPKVASLNNSSSDFEIYDELKEKIAKYNSKKRRLQRFAMEIFRNERSRIKMIENME